MKSLPPRRSLVEALETRTHLAAYHLTFNDEFTTFNQSRWSTSDFWGMRNNGGDYQAQWFSDTANNGYNPFTTNNGVLSITAQPTPAGVNAQGLPYVSGQLTTANKFTQRYGYYELRAKTPPGKGLWSRFWLLGDDGNWPSSSEYDVFEILGKETNKIHQTTHYADANGNHAAQGNPLVTTVDPTGDFHTYGLLWEPGGVTWYVDGTATGTQINRSTSPMYVLIDLAVGNDPGNLWPGNPDASTSFPASLQVDYFRVYSADPSLPSVTPEAGITYPTTLPGNNTVEQTATTPQLPTGWTAGDLGTPDLKAGSATWNSTTGEWLLKGAGYGIGGYGDQGYFAGQSLVGDGAVTATVQTVSAIASNDVKSAVMIRETNSTSARAITLSQVTSYNGGVLTRSLVLQSRPSAGGNTTTIATVTGVNTLSTLRISRTANVFTASYSTDNGASWTTVGTPQTIAMASTVRAGIAIGGNQNNYFRLSRATFNNVTVGVIGPTIIPAISVGGGAASVVTGQSTRFTASVVDQFGNAVDTTTSPVVWSVVGEGGTIAADGTFTAASLVGTGNSTVRASWGTASADKPVSITLPAPWTASNVGTTTSSDTGSVSGNWTVVGGGTGVVINSALDATVDSFRFVHRTMDGDGTVTAQLTASGGAQAGIMIRDSTGAGDRHIAVYRNSTGLQLVSRETTGGIGTLRTPTVLVTTLPIWVRIIRSGASLDSFTAQYSTNGTSWTTIGTRTFSMNATTRAGVMMSSGSASATASASFSNVIVNDVNLAPTVATPAAASPSPVTGKTTALSVLGADDDLESTLSYTWSLVGTNPAPVTFSANGTNAAKNSTATFSKAGAYAFKVTITDAALTTTTSNVNVIVAQTGAITITSPASSVLTARSIKFSASIADQFGDPIETGSTPFVWSLASGTGSIATDGTYTASSLVGTGTATVRASFGSVTKTASITVALPSPWAATNIGTNTAGDTGSVYGNWTVNGGGANVTTSGKNDFFRFVNQPMNGTGTVIAKLTDRGSTSQAGIMIRESTATNSKYAGLWRTSSGLQFATRDSTNANAGSRASVTFTATAVWLRLVQDTSGFTASYSTDGSTWLQVGTRALTMNSGTTVAGLVVATGSTTATSNATFTNVAVTNTAPTVATPASASPATVTGKTTALNVLGADDDGAANLRYTWSVLTSPASAPAPTFSDNATDSARQTTATFYRAGPYQLSVTIADDAGATMTSNVNVTVAQNLTGISLSPSSTQVDLNATRPFTATALDQFGVAMTTQPTFTYAVVTGPGSISSNGLYQAPATQDFATLTASTGGITSAPSGIWTLDLSRPMLTSAVSSKTQGASGDFNLNLALGGVNKTIEPRMNGANKIVFNFSETIKAVDGVLSANEFVITNATFASATISGNQLTLNLSGVVDKKYSSLTLAGLSDLTGNLLSGTATLTVGNLFGDINQGGTVDLVDLNTVKANMLKAVSISNFLLDVNSSGGNISVIDQQYVTNAQKNVLS